MATKKLRFRFVGTTSSAEGYLDRPYLLEHVDEDGDFVIPLSQGISEREQLARKKKKFRERGVYEQARCRSM